MSDFTNCRNCGSVNDASRYNCRTCGYRIKTPEQALPNDPNVTRACEEEIAARGVRGDTPACNYPDYCRAHGYCRRNTNFSQPVACHNAPGVNTPDELMESGPTGTDGSQKPNDAAAIPCAKAGSNPGVTVGAPVPRYSGWLWTHNKRGGEYRMLGEAKLQTDAPLTDMAEVVVYQGADGKLWARAADEFRNRFKRLRPVGVQASDPAYCPICGPKELGHRKDCPYGVQEVPRG